jgi:hypothetical protein
MPEALLKDLGPCSITFNGVDLGKTMGGVTFRDSMNQVEVKEDQAGSTPVDHILTGRTIQVEVPMSRSTLAQLAVVIPGASSFGSYLVVSNHAGIARAASAAMLIISPLVDGAASADKLTIFKASPITDIELAFDNENQRVYKVTFNVYPDADNGNRLYQIGNTGV